ncbi:hypothetical protein ALC62_00489 [Cyphomyrmex costatus]|uniref:Aldehyde dehydrogenase domain-containing protein n=1 Tax=Cyphomyrmex costatus TaxID=456900 RepID=A0A195D6I3_9HYME|nr:hypothetical protein ALC62_00489 [Cyphomyrmex costatus]
MVILEDSDLHAVINCLMITAEQFPLHKIWVQERVSEKLLWLMKSFHFELSVTIDTFQSVKDIQFYQPKRCVNVTIISIWSEDIVAAKNLALSLKSHLVFINKYMDFYGSTVLWPFKSMLFQHLLYKELTIVSQEDETIGQSKEFSRNVVHLSSVIKTNDISIGNLFYDGAWQTPIKGMYWKHNGSLWAQTTCDDFQKCYKSAVNGLQTWSAMSIKTRIQILSRLVSVLKSTGKFVLAAIVERWIKFPYLYNSIQGFIKSDMIEVMQTRESLGVIIILKEESENVLFFRLMQTLISGNPVIVIFDANFCNPSSYFDMFLMCEIPPGVINLLSHEDVSTLEYKLCLDNYTNYVNEIFLKGTSLEAYILPFKRLTIPKQIIISLQ